MSEVPPRRRKIGTLCIIGFDSAWTDRAKAPGAVAVLRVGRTGTVEFKEPVLASFADALHIIGHERERADVCLVAIDQPTIVPNMQRMRPVDRVAASLVSFVGGGVQPANRSKRGMFDDGAPIWQFKRALCAEEDPELSRTSSEGLYLIEVFPALALLALEGTFCDRLCGPRYNPGRRRTFRHDHWSAVVAVVSRHASAAGIDGMALWAAKLRTLETVLKADQDRLDAVLCALIAYRWRIEPRSSSIVIGDVRSGYMISLAGAAADVRLKLAAERLGVPVDGDSGSRMI